MGLLAEGRTETINGVLRTMNGKRRLKMLHHPTHILPGNAELDGLTINLHDAKMLLIRLTIFM